MTEPRDLKLLLPADVADRAARAVARNLRDWVFGGPVTPLTVRLGSPSEATAAAHREIVQAWARAWQDCALDVRWEERRWPSLGRQLLPVAVSIEGADAIAAAAGQTRRWQTASLRCRLLRAFTPDPGWTVVLTATFRYWGPLSNKDFDRLVTVLDWLRHHPDSGLLIRQLPIPGVDTKWLEAHRAVVTTLATALGVPENLGLREREPLRAVVILDAELRSGLPRLFAAPDRQLAELDLRPSRVLVVENLQTLEALPDLPGMVAVFGSGSHATAIAGFDWVRTAEEVRYWGDLDTAGFGILARFRALLACASLLMDSATLQRWRELAVPDPALDPVATAHLTADELSALELLRRDGLRLEQERIPMSAAVAALGRPTDPRVG